MTLGTECKKSAEILHSERAGDRHLSCKPAAVRTESRKAKRYFLFGFFVGRRGKAIARDSLVSCPLLPSSNLATYIIHTYNYHKLQTLSCPPLSPFSSNFFLLNSLPKQMLLTA